MTNYKSLDEVAKTYNYPVRDRQLIMVPNSFVYLPLPSSNEADLSNDFNIYEYISYSLEKPLIESFIRYSLLKRLLRVIGWNILLIISISIIYRY